MKTILYITLFFTTHLFANYAFSNDKTVKIDMHGGKSETLVDKSAFSQMKFQNSTTLQNMTIKKPTNPVAPTVEEVELKNKNNEGNR